MAQFRHDRFSTGTLVGLLLGIAALGIGRVATAELPMIRFDRITPLGCEAGQTVELDILGAQIDNVATLLFDHAGLSAEFVKEKRFKIKVAADVPAGTYDVWLRGKWGVSNPHLFSVSRGFTDVTEQEPNNDLEKANRVPVNCAIQGASDGNNDDWFLVTGKPGSRITIDCQSARLDTALDANLVVTRTDGRVLAANGDYYGRDPFVDFVLPESGECVVRIHDLSYRGGFPYRLLISDRPHVENVSPRAVKSGQATPLAVFGRNFGTHGKPSSWRIEEQPLEEATFSFTAPAEIVTRGQFRFVDHPTHHSVLPTAATSSLVGAQVVPEVGGVASTPLSMLVVECDVLGEVEPNDVAEKSQPLKLPAVVSARFDRARDSDWYEFDVDEAGSYAVDVYCERLGGRADPFAVVIDAASGARVVELDDFGPRVNAFDGHLRDPSGSVSLQKGKKYRLLIQDRYARGGARLQYVLSLRRAQPDFAVSLIHSQNPGPGGWNVLKGGAAFVDVVVHLKEGYNGEVVLKAEGLPAGVHASPITLRNDTRGAFVIWADKEADDFAGPIRITATGSRGETVLTRDARAYCRVSTDTNLNSSRPMRETLLCVSNAAPFELTGPAEPVSVVAGQKAEFTLKLTRHWSDFKEKMTLQPLALKGGLQVPTVEIGAGRNEGTVAVTVANNVPPGEYSVVFTGQAQVPFSPDPMATTRPNTLVTLPSRPITLKVQAAPK